jgi:hypothetical protein
MQNSNLVSNPNLKIIIKNIFVTKCSNKIIRTNKKRNIKKNNRKNKNKNEIYEMENHKK